MWGFSLARRLFLTHAVLYAYVNAGLALTFKNSNPTQCDDLTVTWQGGQPPFRLLIIPPGQSVRNFSIPSSAFKNGAGSFSTQLSLPEHQRVMFTISDASGTTPGGVTDLLTVGPSVSGQNCNITVPAVDFFFSLDSDLQECKSYPFTLYSKAVQPITIVGFVVSGQAFTLHPAIGDSYTWKNNLTAGTSVAFAMTDSKGRDGGTADVRVVQLSDDKSCQGTPKPVPAPISTGVIIGAVVAGVAGLAIVLILAFLWWRRNARENRISKSKGKVDLLYDPLEVYAPTELSESDLPAGQSVITPFHSENGVIPPSQRTSKAQLMAMESSRPSTLYPSSGLRVSQLTDHSRLHPGLLSIRPTSSQGSSSNGPSRESAYASGDEDYLASSQSGTTTYPPQQRVIVHTDITDTDMEGPLELPPQYSDSRRPIPGLASNDNAASTSPSPRKS